MHLQASACSVWRARRFNRSSGSAARRDMPWSLLGRVRKYCRLCCRVLPGLALSLSNRVLRPRNLDLGFRFVSRCLHRPCDQKTSACRNPHNLFLEYSYVFVPAQGGDLANARRAPTSRAVIDGQIGVESSGVGI